MSNSLDLGGKIQLAWRFCPKCQGMHFAGFPDFKGVAPLAVSMIRRTVSPMR